MDIDAVLKSIEPRIRDDEQRQRIRTLAVRVSTSFEKTRAKGVKDELESDWNKIKGRFESVLKTVQNETGLY